MNPTAAVRPLPGAGLAARTGDLLLVCADSGAGVDELLGVVAEVAAAGGDGSVLVRRVAALLAADFDGRYPACAVTGPAPDGRLAVLVHGAATVDVAGADGAISLSGMDAITSVNRLVNGPVAGIRMQLSGAGPADRRARLDGGVVTAAGVEWVDEGVTLAPSTQISTLDSGWPSPARAWDQLVQFDAGVPRWGDPVPDAPAGPAEPPPPASGADEAEDRIGRSGLWSTYRPTVEPPPVGPIDNSQTEVFLPPAPVPGEPPAVEAPAAQPPSYGAPSNEAASPAPPAYEPPAYEPPVYGPPAYEPPAYGPPAGEAPVEELAAAQPLPQRPSFPHPSYLDAPPEERAYQPPAPAVDAAPQYPYVYPDLVPLAPLSPAPMPSIVVVPPPPLGSSAEPVVSISPAISIPPVPPVVPPPPVVPGGPSGSPFAAEPAVDGPAMRQPDPASPFVAVLLGESVAEGTAGPGPDPRPRVLGVMCVNAHFNDPTARYCALCGIAMSPEDQAKHEAPRPPLGFLLVDDGSAFRLDVDYVIGREPHQDPEVLGGTVRPLRINDAEGIVSRRHARISLVGWDVQVVDLGSANGTYVAYPGDAQRTQLIPNQPIVVRPGAQVTVGRRWLRFDSHRNP